MRRRQVLRVGLAGLGTMGRNHLRHLVSRADVQLVAVADPAVSVQHLAPQHAMAIRSYAQSEEMLEEELLDALIVAVPTTLHHMVTLNALNRGLPVLVEKPLAASVSEARDLVEVAARLGALVQVGHVERFNPAVMKLVECLREGALSRIFTVRTIRGGPLPERIRDVGVAIDLATHDLDIVCQLLGERPVRAYAEATRHVHTAHEDLLYGLLSFPSGAMAQIDVNWLTPEKQRRITVLGEEGMFELDLLSQSLLFVRSPKRLEPHYLKGFAPVFEGVSAPIPVTPSEPLALELDAFFEAVRSGTGPVINGEQGLWALVLAQVLLESASEHRAIAVDQLSRVS